MNQITNQDKVILNVINLKKYFVNKANITKAVDGVSFTVKQGQIVGLIGESGSGKTTLARALLRLYESYNGFVTLDGTIISGRKIGKKRIREMRQKIQMIFQDPYAALNGQKNVYSILKEPLIVNKIIHKKLVAIFKDWSILKKTFKTEFIIKILEIEIENHKLLYDLAKVHVQTWKTAMDQIEFNKNNSLDDNFASIFAYLDEEQKINTAGIDKMYSGLTNLLNFYYECQDKFAKNKLYYDEFAIIKTKKELKHLKLSKKFSEFAIQSKNQREALKEELKTFLSNEKNFRKNTRNVFINYVEEFKNEEKLNKIERLNSSDLDSYHRFYSLEHLYKVLGKVCVDLQTKCAFISFNDALALIKELQTYGESFYNQYLNDSKTLNVAKIREMFFNFNFDLQKWIALNERAFNDFTAKRNDFHSQINELKNNIVRTFIDPDAKRTLKQNLINKKRHLKDLMIMLNAKIADHHHNNYDRVEELTKQLKQLKSLYKSEIIAQKTVLDAKYKLVLNKFFMFCEEIKVTNKVLLSTYKRRISDKYESLKSFKIEQKYLMRDIFSLKLLCGYVPFFAKKPDSYQSLAVSYFLDLLSYPFVRHTTKNLLIKTQIFSALEDVGLLKQFAYRYPHEFSGGQRQRIVIARSLITNPKVILADEPIASLDISIQAQVVNLLRDLCEKKGIAMVFIAHDLSMIEYLAHHVEIIHLGKIVEAGDTVEIYSNPIHPYTLNLFKAIPKISNANQKFENIKFETAYLEEQRFPNVPINHVINDQHTVYGTNEQVKKWTTLNASLTTES